MAEGFRSVADLEGDPSWKDGKGEAEAQAALVMSDKPLAAAALEDATLLAREIARIEERLARLERIARDGGEALRRRLRRVVAELADLGSEEFTELRRGLDRLETHAVVTPDLFPDAARLVGRGESLRGRAGVVRAERSFGEAVRASDWNKARAILDGWPGGADATSRTLSQSLISWGEIERRAEGLLSAPRSAAVLASLTVLAGRLESETPAGFEAAARRLAGRLSSLPEAARAAARTALAEARSLCGSHEEAAALAAERSLLETVPDRRAAAEFCRELQALERELDAADRHLERTPPDIEFVLELPGKIGGLRERVAAARLDWWPADRLPRPEREWKAFVDEANRLIGKGRGGLAAAHRLRDTRAPAGWEDWARRLPIPPIPAVDRRRWLTAAAAAGVVAAALTIFLEYDRLKGVVEGFLPRKSAATGAAAIPTASPAPAAPTPAPAPAAIPPGQRVWVHGPAFATLHVEVNGAGSTVDLPGTIEMPRDGPATIWLASGEKTTGRVEVREGAAGVQGKIDELSAQLNDVPARLPQVDAQVQDWAEEVLQRATP